MVLRLSLKDNYLIYKIENYTIKTLIASVIKELISVESFNKNYGIVELKLRLELLNGEKCIENDWFDITDDLKFIYENPMDIIKRIDKIEIE